MQAIKAVTTYEFEHQRDVNLQDLIPAIEMTAPATSDSLRLKSESD